MTNIPLEHTTVMINGHVCEEWPDGLKAVSLTGMRNGPVTFKFRAESRSTAFFGQQFTEILQGAVKNFDGSITNNQKGFSIRLSRGTMVTGPSGFTLGNSEPLPMEFVIDFQEILTNSDGFLG